MEFLTKKDTRRGEKLGGGVGVREPHELYNNFSQTIHLWNQYERLRKKKEFLDEKYKDIMKQKTLKGERRK